MAKKFWTNTPILKDRKYIEMGMFVLTRKEMYQYWDGEYDLIDNVDALINVQKVTMMGRNQNVLFVLSFIFPILFPIFFYYGTRFICTGIKFIDNKSDFNEINKVESNFDENKDIKDENKDIKFDQNENIKI